MKYLIFPAVLCFGTAIYVLCYWRFCFKHSKSIWMFDLGIVLALAGFTLFTGSIYG